MSRRFVKEFANYLLDSLYPKETKGKIRKVVYNYEVTGLISTRQAMYSLSDIARERENIAYDPETGESTILNSANENQSSAEMPKNSDDAMVSDFLKSKQKMLDYILQFAAEREWENEHDLDQNRALFTAWCFMFRIDADTPECDEVLKKIYRIAALQDLMPYEYFSIFMISLIN